MAGRVSERAVYSVFFFRGGAFGTGDFLGGDFFAEAFLPEGVTLEDFSLGGFSLEGFSLEDFANLLKLRARSTQYSSFFLVVSASSFTLINPFTGLPDMIMG